MRFSKLHALLLSLPLTGCALFEYRTSVHSANQLPPAQDAVLHRGRLWIELKGLTEDTQCVQPSGERKLCFEDVRTALLTGLKSTLWSSFPEVAEKRRGDSLEPGDYVLLVDLKLEALPPDGDLPGWSAGVKGSWTLVRDGLPQRRGAVASRSGGEYPYGRRLGRAAGQVVDAVTVHIGEELAVLPESRPAKPVSLPRVAAR